VPNVAQNIAQYPKRLLCRSCARGDRCIAWRTIGDGGGRRSPEVGKPLPHRHHFYAMYRGPSFAPPAALPHAPEYGFLRRVPANAIGGPGYTFVPGVGNLGESCDLPTSPCTNGYRDVQ
jgi:hypothetical protein